MGARAATSAARGTVGGHLAGAQGHQGIRIHAVGGSVGTTRGAGGVRATIGVRSDRSGKVQTWEAQTRGGRWVYTNAVSKSIKAEWMMRASSKAVWKKRISSAFLFLSLFFLGFV